MNNNSFFKNTLILTSANITTGILGFIFSIILSRELGAEGIGLYGLIMPIYNLFICLICGGIATAISKISAEYSVKSSFKNLRLTIKTSLTFNIIWSLIVALLVFLLSSKISYYIIKDSRTLYSLRIICPAMIFVALSNTLKGYFYGTSLMSVPAFIDISEKFIRIVIIYSLVTYFHFSDVTHTVTAAYSALLIGEIFSFFLLYTYFKFNIKKMPVTSSSERPEGRAQLLFNIFIISVPLCFNGIFTSILSTFSTLMLPRRLMHAGIEYSIALSMIGKFTNMAINIVFFPSIIIGSISTVLIPDLTKSINKKDYYAAQRRILQVLKLSFALGLCTLFICLLMPNQLGQILYNRSDLGNYIRFAALSAPIFYPAATTFGILNGLGKQSIILRNSLIISILELILLYSLSGIPGINIYGFGITLLITSSLTLILNFIEISKHISFN